MIWTGLTNYCDKRHWISDNVRSGGTALIDGIPSQKLIFFHEPLLHKVLIIITTDNINIGKDQQAGNYRAKWIKSGDKLSLSITAHRHMYCRSEIVFSLIFIICLMNCFPLKQKQSNKVRENKVIHESTLQRTNGDEKNANDLN